MFSLETLRSLVLLALHSINNLSGSRVEFTFPGTNWCGPGNSSRNSNDLGVLKQTDFCCKEHDLCPKYILSNETAYGLINDVPYTRSTCDCDMEFYQCLHNVQSDPLDNFVSILMGNIYFTFLEDRCFEKAPEMIKCKIKKNSENCTVISSEKYVWKTMPGFYSVESDEINQSVQTGVKKNITQWQQKKMFKTA